MSLNIIPSIQNLKSVNSVSVVNSTEIKPPASQISAQQNISSNAGAKAVFNLRTELNIAEQPKYAIVSAKADKETKKNLEGLLKRGILLNSDSQDKSTTLDNLYKIITTPRANGLKSEVLLKETVNTLTNPFHSTQTFGDIPKEFQNLAIAKNQEGKTSLVEKQNAAKEINVENSGSCPAASIEFSLARSKPAEFARFMEGLSSPNLSVQKEIHLNNLADNTLDAVWLLNAFKIPYEMKDFNTAKITFAPDKNALIRAQIQTDYKDPLERSVVDVLMQSTFMQVGSQQTYNSLSDRRAQTFSPNTSGLIEFEKTFTESVVKDKNKITLTNQVLNDDGVLTGYETDLKVFADKIVKTISLGEDVIIGYTYTDEKNKVIGGHEITIVGVRQDDKTGKLMFICNDSDDDYFGAIEYADDYLLPKIHHATFPKEVVENDIDMRENWAVGLQAYKEMKKSA